MIGQHSSAEEIFSRLPTHVFDIYHIIKNGRRMSFSNKFIGLQIKFTFCSIN